MRLGAVTVRNYRVHRELTVAFDASRTVIGGPNEAGKSTLVEALHHAFFLRSRATGAVQKAMLSEFHAGHPTVEVRFESGGREYLLTKVFSGNQAASTTLRQQPGPGAAGGRTLHNEEAEARIHEILQAADVGGGRGLENRIRMQWAHLWVWQGSATDDPLVHANTDRPAELLRDRLARVEGGGVIESPLDAAAAREIAARCAATFTEKGQPRSGSMLDRALEGLSAADAAVAQAAAVVQALDTAVDTIDASDRTVATCVGELATTRAELDEVRTRQREAADLGVRIAEEQAAAAAAEAAHAEAVRADAEIGGCRAEIDALASRLDPEVQQLTALEDEERHSAARCDEATREMVAASQRQAAAAAAYALHEVHENHARLHVEREGLGGRCGLIATQREQGRRLAAELALLPTVADDDVAELARLDRARESAAATLEAIATKVEVLATPGTVTLADATLAVGTPVTITAAAELVVGDAATGATVVRISPGGGRSLAEATARLEEARTALDAALLLRGFDTIDRAREACIRRQSLAADLRAVHLTIEGLGGERAEADLAALDAEIATVAAELARRSPAGPAAPPPLVEAQAASADAEADLDAAGKAVASAAATAAAAQSRLETVVARRHEVAERLRVNRTALESLRTKAAVLEQRHGTDRLPHIVALDDARRRAADRLAGSRDRLARLAPDDLERERLRLERALTSLSATQQEAETRRQIARARLELEGTSDPREDLARAAARRRLAAADHARAVRDADAIRLLATLFAEKKREVESQFVAPLAGRVRGYLERLYGDGTTVGVESKDGRFSRLTITRPGAAAATFEFAQLSAGAREQVAAAFRLAMAEVLAEDHDGCLPVVFDDAFVNSDADRQRALQRLLDLAASRGLQVIVLSCRPESYAALGAATVRLPDNPQAGRDRG